MHPFDEQKVGAIRALQRLWPNTPMSLVGASAVACHIPFEHRITQDIDLALAVGIDDAHAALTRELGWVADARIPHRWASPTGVSIDLIPVEPALLAAGEVIWPGGQRFTLLGFRHALSSTVTVSIADDAELQVASVPALCLLKTIAYESSPVDRERDLGDIAWLLELGVHQNDEARFSSLAVASRLPDDLLGAFLLGARLRALIDASERRALLAFHERVMGALDGGRTQTVMNRKAPSSWKADPDRVLHVFRAFRRGLGD